MLPDIRQNLNYLTIKQHEQSNEAGGSQTVRLPGSYVTDDYPEDIPARGALDVQETSTIVVASQIPTDSKTSTQGIGKRHSPSSTNLNHQPGIHTGQAHTVNLWNRAPGMAGSLDCMGQEWKVASADGYWSGTPVPHTPLESAGTTAQYYTVENTAKRAVIQELLGDGMAPGEVALMEKALSHFSLDNLLLLKDYSVKYQIKNLFDMPEDFDGFDIKEHFMDGHRDMIDRAARNFVETFDDLKGVDVNKMDLVQKKRFIKEQIETRNCEIRVESQEFGLTTLVTKDNLKELDNISNITGTTFPVLSYPGAGVFLLRHRLSEGVIIHETAHALDILKNIEQDPGGLKQMRRDHVIISASERDWAIGAHYEWFQLHCQDYPQDRWSNYALGGMAYEYSAEAVRLFFENPEKLKVMDSDMYNFAKAFVTERHYPHLRYEYMEFPSELVNFVDCAESNLNTNRKLPERHRTSSIPELYIG